ncbi:hypothetical protein DSO57_1014188 [Entomophthora muscae]|uniref:Uncharacterized protein n=2 Tax=Entomophthora muscae TaxID=34485 RepID=A0ACC2SIA8_9FUNG|nr:hypothetical protein DSO57_1014452 [Entomophthora muscae]KAJ9062118.1 hypothetical protein DSO57_1014188 [Entomophthora muscae]
MAVAYCNFEQEQRTKPFPKLKGFKSSSSRHSSYCLTSMGGLDLVVIPATGGNVRSSMSPCRNIVPPKSPEVDLTSEKVLSDEERKMIQASTFDDVVNHGYRSPPLSTTKGFLDTIRLSLTPDVAKAQSASKLALL